MILDRAPSRNGKNIDKFTPGLGFVKVLVGVNHEFLHSRILPVDRNTDLRIRQPKEFATSEQMIIWGATGREIQQ